MNIDPWLIGKLLSPFAALLLVWLITSPIRRAMERRMKEGRLKQLLLMDRDKHPWKFGLAWCVLVFGMMIVGAIISIIFFPM